ncbi:hypothetical protein [Nitrosomonas ureae]|uniref:Translation initiation factor IF-2 n=1 Tax=Nitrosomonas ureae TaxID=44577 RepID=A0A1H2EPF5_9PROT|nr:hypothetical protein [Nitrosomonas ureae]ALQ51916.1 hypothetical protein ATY38_12210 [Nitrosomonas ureae]SDT96628.1 translation initiation factor IF-2 [Nitrosomonas ureae]
MAKTTSNQDPVLTQEDTKSSATAEQSSALEAEAKGLADEAAAKAKAEADAKAVEEKSKSDAAAAQADAEAKRLADEAEKAKQLDMSLPARKSRAQDALDEALQAQERIKTIVSERTKALDALIIEESSLVDKNPMSEIQFYLTRQNRKREEKAEKKKAMLERGLDPDELIKALETRAPIDQKGGSGRKQDPRSVRTTSAK